MNFSVSALHCRCLVGHKISYHLTFNQLNISFTRRSSHFNVSEQQSTFSVFTFHSLIQTRGLTRGFGEFKKPETA